MYPLSIQNHSWQYIGTESIIGQDKKRPGQSSSETTHRSIYDEPSATAAARVQQTGYNYMPLYRNIYGHSPRRTGLKSIYA